MRYEESFPTLYHQQTKGYFVNEKEASRRARQRDERVAEAKKLYDQLYDYHFFGITRAASLALKKKRGIINDFAHDFTYPLIMESNAVSELFKGAERKTRSLKSLGNAIATIAKEADRLSVLSEDQLLAILNMEDQLGGNKRNKHKKLMAFVKHLMSESPATTR